MLSLADLKTDSAAIADGKWVKIDKYPGLEIKSRGYTDKFVDAQAQRLRKAAERFRGDVSAIPNAMRRNINAGLLRDFLVLDVKGLHHDREKKNPVTVEEFKELLGNPDYRELMAACWEAAALVTTQASEHAEEAEGN
ncbi:hypothetical protein SRCM100623_02316 [Acetobacter pasteurianus]|uniref:Uncharacterized protein n=1 Tax=Acetobacter pasteurianus TaxID=438 RepID=A0A1A0D1S3_ACEPA|nr:hypothetical protein [Acetobacter pasteurianus]OAZ69010.1 hypothetical protein SRCM100623_02316 [Acetobacter pasteurianus]